MTVDRSGDRLAAPRGARADSPVADSATGLSWPPWPSGRPPRSACRRRRHPLPNSDRDPCRRHRPRFWVGCRVWPSPLSARCGDRGGAGGVPVTRTAPACRWHRRPATAGAPGRGTTARPRRNRWRPPLPHSGLLAPARYRSRRVGRGCHEARGEAGPDIVERRAPPAASARRFRRDRHGTPAGGGRGPPLALRPAGGGRSRPALGEGGASDAPAVPGPDRRCRRSFAGRAPGPSGSLGRVACGTPRCRAGSGPAPARAGAPAPPSSADALAHARPGRPAAGASCASGSAGAWAHSLSRAPRPRRTPGGRPRARRVGARAFTRGDHV